jgi:arabinose-5-phosphate isomerase
MSDFLKVFDEVLEIEASALNEARKNVSPQAILGFSELMKQLIQSSGALFISGIGKSGLIGQKIAATFTSLGLPTHFIHPTEALHGDLGRLTSKDAIIVISKSGNTEELLKLIPHLPMSKKQVVGILGNIRSPLGNLCELVFDGSVVREACLNNVAPTTSTTLTCAIGDALANIYQVVAGFTKEKFAQGHPGGLLGKSLNLRVKDVMITFSLCPQIDINSTLKVALKTMNENPKGFLLVMKDNKYEGILVEGDIRRCLIKYPELGVNAPILNVVNSRPIIISQNQFIYEAITLMEKREKPITLLPVFDELNFTGVIRLQDILKFGSY